MSDKEEGNGAVVEGKTQMAEAEEPQKLQQQDESKKPGKINISLSIWPPTQRTRDAVINRLVETLSTPSILSKRYGVIPSDEAASAARLIEEEAFSTAASAAAANTDEDDGMEILQVYSKEISKRMLEAVKSRASSDSAPNPPQIPDAADAAASATDETPSVEAESS